MGPDPNLLCTSQYMHFAKKSGGAPHLSPPLSGSCHPVLELGGLWTPLQATRSHQPLLDTQVTGICKGSFSY